MAARYHGILTYLQAKRFFQERGKAKVKEKIELKDPNDKIFAAQIFAEMLGMANHPEFYRYEDQEVYKSHPCHRAKVSVLIFPRHLLFSLCTPPSSCTTAPSIKPI